MKARYKENILIGKQQVAEQVQTFVNEHYDRIVDDITVQFMAVILCALEKDYGWRKERLKKFIRSVQDYAEIVGLGKIFDKEISTHTCIEYIEKKYDIDLKKSCKEFRNE